jgi:hypothetical protein
LNRIGSNQTSNGIIIGDRKIVLLTRELKEWPFFYKNCGVKPHNNLLIKVLNSYIFTIFTKT